VLRVILPSNYWSILADFGQSERKSGAVIVKNIKEMSYQLVRNISMILSCHAFANSRLHQPGQRWQHVDWRINLEKKVKQVIVSLDIKAIVVKILSANFVYRLKLQYQNKTTF